MVGVAWFGKRLWTMMVKGRERERRSLVRGGKRKEQRRKKEKKSNGICITVWSLD